MGGRTPGRPETAAAQLEDLQQPPGRPETAAAQLGDLQQPPGRPEAAAAQLGDLQQLRDQAIDGGRPYAAELQSRGSKVPAAAAPSQSLPAIAACPL